MPPPKPTKVYRLKITLAEVEPPVWRRLLVPHDITLARLHRLIQAAMGWTNSHLHCFEAGDARYGMTSAEEDEVEDERRVHLCDLRAPTCSGRPEARGAPGSA